MNLLGGTKMAIGRWLLARKVVPSIYKVVQWDIAFSALTLFAGHHEDDPVCKN